ncbi:EpsG family protein [Peribacillus frigoritolerans]|uniref:EpsG family protein n=1 Tax=Peribacillus frigoritolerans TaxID=450367 RepID=UPI001404B25E|nr:EpsG family protein [Peribacillus frigoritolerans]
MTVGHSYLLYYFIVISTYIIVNISARVSRTNYTKLGKIIFYLAILIPWIIASNRYGIGTDYYNYEKMYYNITNFGSILESIINSSYEPGWIILNYVVKYIFNNEVKYIFVISSLLILFFNFSAIYTYRKRINMSIAIFILMCTLYNPSFNIIRQSLAMAILLFSLKYIDEKKVLKFILLVVLAGSFHYSAFIFVPVYWVLNNNYYNFWSKFKIFVFYLLFILIVVQFEPLFNSLINVGVFSKYNIYEINSNGSIGIGNIIVRLPVILIILLNLKELRKKDPFMGGVTVLYFISLILYFLGYKADYLARIAVTFEMMQIFILSSIIRSQNDLSRKYLYYLLIILYYFIYFTYFILMGNYGETIPYITK